MTSALGEGILSGFAGALGGAEQYIQEERQFNRSKSLEDYRFQKEKELKKFEHDLKQQLEKQRVKQASIDRAEEIGYQSARDDRLHKMELDEIAARNKDTDKGSTKAFVESTMREAQLDLETEFPGIGLSVSGGDATLGESGKARATRPEDIYDYVRALNDNNDPRAPIVSALLRELAGMQGDPETTMKDVRDWKARYKEALSKKDAAPPPPPPSPEGTDIDQIELQRKRDALRSKYG